MFTVEMTRRSGFVSEQKGGSGEYKHDRMGCEVSLIRGVFGIYGLTLDMQVTQTDKLSLVLHIFENFPQLNIKISKRSPHQNKANLLPATSAADVYLI